MSCACMPCLREISQHLNGHFTSENGQDHVLEWHQICRGMPQQSELDYKDTSLGYCKTPTAPTLAMLVPAAVKL